MLGVRSVPHSVHVLRPLLFHCSPPSTPMVSALQVGFGVASAVCTMVEFGYRSLCRGLATLAMVASKMQSRVLSTG